MSKRTNAARVARARAAINAYSNHEGESIEYETDAQDLITDCLHLSASLGVDAEGVIRRAVMNFEAEAGGGE